MRSLLDIRIGTLTGGSPTTAETIRSLLPHGFESFQITFWQTLGDTDLARLAGEVRQTLDGSGAVISSLGVFGNIWFMRDHHNGCAAFVQAVKNIHDFHAGF